MKTVCCYSNQSPLMSSRWAHLTCQIPSTRYGITAWHRAWSWDAPLGPQELFGISVLSTLHLQKLEQPIVPQSRSCLGLCCSSRKACRARTIVLANLWWFEMTSSAILLSAQYKEAYLQHYTTWSSLHEFNWHNRMRVKIVTWGEKHFWWWREQGRQ